MNRFEKNIIIENNKKNLFSYKMKLENILIAMFDYQNLPDNVFKRFIELSFIRYGVCGFDKVNDLYYTDFPVFSGELNQYGFLNSAYLITRTGENGETKEINKGIAIGFNNSVWQPDIDLLRFAQIFTECDKSILALLLNSRMHPVPIAKDSKEQQSINELFNNMYNGTLHSIIKDDKESKILQGDNYKPFNLLTLCDPKQIETLQYISKTYDDNLRRFIINYGIPLQSTGKMAQINEKELQGYDLYSQILPSDRLECRKEFVDNINRIFDLKIEVKLSGVWEKSFEKSMEVKENINETLKEMEDINNVIE